MINFGIEKISAERDYFLFCEQCLDHGLLFLRAVPRHEHLDRAIDDAFALGF